MAEAFHKIVEGADAINVKALLRDQLVRVVVEAFAESFHELFVSGDRPQHVYILLVVLFVVVVADCSIIYRTIRSLLNVISCPAVTSEVLRVPSILQFFGAQGNWQND